MSDSSLGRTLLAIARDAIGSAFAAPAGTAGDARPDFRLDPRLDAPGATFVTLMQDEALRGCIGTLEAVRPLRADVAHNARHAAFSDPRFAPLLPAEFGRVDIEVSLLGPRVPLACNGVEDLATRLRPGVDGLVLRHGRHHATFLPQVWEALPEPRAFVRELLRKAGLPPGFWDAEMVVERYAVAKWRERDFPAARGMPPPAEVLPDA